LRVENNNSSNGHKIMKMQLRVQSISLLRRNQDNTTGSTKERNAVVVEEVMSMENVPQQDRDAIIARK